MGVVTTALVCCQAALGVSVFFFSPARAFTKALGLGSDDTRGGADLNNVADARARLAPYHRFFGAAAFVAGAGTCVSGLVEKQAFLKCPIDPTYKFCAVVALPNVMVVLVLLVASCACGATYARSVGRRDAEVRGASVRRDGAFLENETREDARSALMSARRRTRGNDEYPGYDDSLEY